MSLINYKLKSTLEWSDYFRYMHRRWNPYGPPYWCPSPLTYLWFSKRTRQIQEKWYQMVPYQDFCFKPLRVCSFVDDSNLEEIDLCQYDIDLDMGLLKTGLISPFRTQPRNILSFIDHYDSKFFNHWSDPSLQNENLEPLTWYFRENHMKSNMPFARVLSDKIAGDIHCSYAESFLCHESLPASEKKLFARSVNAMINHIQQNALKSKTTEQLGELMRRQFEIKLNLMVRLKSRPYVRPSYTPIGVKMNQDLFNSKSFFLDLQHSLSFSRHDFACNDVLLFLKRKKFCNRSLILNEKKYQPPTAQPPPPPPPPPPPLSPPSLPHHLPSYTDACSLSPPDSPPPITCYMTTGLNKCTTLGCKEYYECNICYNCPICDAFRQCQHVYNTSLLTKEPKTNNPLSLMDISALSIRKSVATQCFSSYPNAMDFKKTCLVKELLQVQVTEPYFSPLPDVMCNYLTSLVINNENNPKHLFQFNSYSKLEQVGCSYRKNLIKSQKSSVFFESKCLIKN